MTWIAVYGTLRKGMRLHWMLGHEPKFVGRGVISFARLFTHKVHNYPIAVMGDFGKVVVEVYDVPDMVEYNINKMESSADFRRITVPVKLEDGTRLTAKAYIQYMQNSKFFGHRIISGDYAKHLEELRNLEHLKEMIKEKRRVTK